jgi:hypothetical protein
MKTGKTLTELAQELERQQNNKRDFLADTRKLEMLPSAAMRIEGIDEFPLTHRCHLQVADRVGIPAKYYQVMKNIAPSLLATNVNWWLQTKPEKRMIRTLDGNARAFLSERLRSSLRIFSDFEPKDAARLTGSQLMPVIRRLSKLKSQTNKDKNAKNSMENVPSKYRKIFERAKEGLSRADAIHAKCLRCMGMLREEVRKCSDSDCPLFSFRPYSVSGNPKKRQIKKK